MISVLYKQLERYATPGMIILGLVIVVLFNLIFFPEFAKCFGVSIPLDLILDLRLYYSSKEVYNFIESLGEKGRDVYQLSEMLVDLSYMIIHTILYSIIIIRLLKLIFENPKK